MTRLRQVASACAKASADRSPGQARLSLLLLLVAAPLLGGCETLTGSVAGSCGVFERPPYAVRGQTQYDQNVADNFVESGVAGCNWQRPASRPAAIEAQPAPKAAAPARRKGILKRIRDRIALPKPFPAAAEPVAPTPEPPTVGLPLPAPDVIERPDPVEQLLHPKGG